VQFPRLGLSSSAEKELAQLREENARLKSLAGFAWFADHPVPAFIVSARTGKILDANFAAQRQYRYERKEMLNLNLEQFRANTGSGSFSRLDLANSMGQKQNWVVRQVRRDGSIFSAEMMVTPLTYQDQPAELVQVIDVSRRVDAELELRHLERRYNWLMENATESIWRFELEVPIPLSLPVGEQIERIYRYGYLAEASRSTAQVYGYPKPQAMSGMRLETMMPRNEVNLAYLRHFIERGYEVKQMESKELDREGNTKWFRNNLFGEVEAGLLVRAWGSSIDITNTKQLEEQQQQSNQLWYEALENMHLLAMFVDDQAIITYVNPHFVKVTGWQKADVLGKSFMKTFNPEYASLGSKFEEHIKTNKIAPFCSNTFRTRDDRVLHIHWNNTAVHDAEGKSIGVFSIGEDITERRSAELGLKESEERYRRMAEGIPVGLYRSTPEGCMIYGNPVVAKLLQVTTVEAMQAINLQTWEFGPSYDRTAFIKQLEADGEVIGLEYQWKLPDGTHRWVRENARVLREADGKVQWYEGTLEDITETRQTQEKLVQSEELYRKLSETAPIGILLTNNAVVQHANPFVTKMLGYDSTEEIIGKPVLEFIHPADRQDLAQRYFVDPMELDKQTTEESRLLRKDGAVVMAQAQISRMLINQHRGSIIVVRDISAQRQSEQEMRRWQQRILKMQKLESLGLLAGGLAHDFNNQLTVIMGHASLLDKQMPKDDPLHKLLRPIEQAAQHATNLCQQMLSFAGRGKIETHQVNLTKLIQSTEALLKIATGKKADLLLELDPDVPTIQAEAAQLRQVLINLVSNAAESFTEGHRGQVSVRTSVMKVDENYPKMELTLELPAGEYLCLEVADNGGGMDADTRRRVFEPFFTTRTTGRGLGLPAVLGIVRSHNGAIEVNSKLRHGTSIRVFLPLQQAPATSNQVNQSMAQASATILVVDDELSLRSLASQVLRNHGFHVIEAEDGMKACELVQQGTNPIQLVLVDLTMPVMDGVETLKQIWATQPHIPAIAMSSYGHVEIEDRCKGLPLKAILPKPFTPLALEQLVSRALSDYPN
jgi:two-component system, cell cycle sensor histidine kinase and response regulator CckA